MSGLRGSTWWRVGLVATACAVGTGTAMAGGFTGPAGPTRPGAVAVAPAVAPSAAPAPSTDPQAPAPDPSDGTAGVSGPADRRPSEQERSGLRVVEAEAAGVRPGGTTTLRALVANYGPDPTDADFAVKVRIPARAAPVGPYYPADCRADPAEAGSLDCTFDAGLPLLRTAVLEIPVRVDGGVLAGERLAGGQVTVYDPDHPDISHSRAFAIQTD